MTRVGSAYQQGYSFSLPLKVYLCLPANQCLWKFQAVFHMLEAEVKFSSQAYPYGRHSTLDIGHFLFKKLCREEKIGHRHSEEVTKCTGDKSPKK